MLQLVRLDQALPEGFHALRAEAQAEGHSHMTRLAEELTSGATRFAALLAAFDDGDLLGIGGLTAEPSDTPEPAMRMRRLYVSPAPVGPASPAPWPTPCCRKRSIG